MALGLTFGRTDEQDADAKIQCYNVASEYYEWFKTNFSCRCDAIITGDFAGHTDICLSIIEKASAKVQELIERKNTQGN